MFLRRLPSGALLLLALCVEAHGGSVVRADSPEEWLRLGLPREAVRSYVALPPAARHGSPALPRLLRDLAGAGKEDEALRLFHEELPRLAEPVRSAAILEAGKIRWRRKEHDEAADLFRRIRPGSPEAQDAAAYVARHLAARGDPGGAIRTLGAAPDGPVKSRLAAEIGRMRGGPESAPPERARESPGADVERASGIPGKVEFLSALARARLSSGDRAGALEAAREGLADIGRWRSAVAAQTLWDGTHPGAEASLAGAVSLFPFGEDVSALEAPGRRFLSLSALHRTLVESRERAASLARDARRRADAVRARIALHSGKRARLEQVEGRFRDDARRSGGVPRRLLLAADELSVTGWGERSDRHTAALLDETAERLSRISAAARKLGSTMRARVAWEDTRGLPPEDQRMIIFARDRLAKAGGTLEALEAKVTLLRAKVWARWKESYAERLSRDFDAAESARARGEEGAARARRIGSRLRGESAELAAWETFLGRMEERMTVDAAALGKARADVHRFAAEALAAARNAAGPAIARKERGLHRLAGRAAAEWFLEGKPAAADNGAGTPPPAMLPEAIRHLEASIPPAGERAPHMDETLYTLAALRFEEAERGYYGGRDGERKDAPDLAVPARLFRKVADDFPGSPYGEAAFYGLSLCLQESGAPDNAAAVLETLLSRYPATRYADEANLRLGEHRFDRYDFPGAETAYRKVRDGAAPEVAITARFKLGWALFLQGRPAEAAEKFTEASLLSAGASRTGGLREEARRMTARSLIEAGAEREAETFLSRRAAAAEGGAVLLEIERLLEAQNRYDEAAAVATRLGAAYPLAPERVSAEEEAAAALRKGGRIDESMSRRGAFHAAFGPGTPWRKSPGRTAAEISRADSLSMEGLTAAGFHFHAAAREKPPGDRSRVLALYDAFLSRFPAAEKSGEVAYQRAWLLFEDGRKRDALPAFEAVARRPSGARGEAARYMAVPCAKDLSSPADAASQGEIVRLAGEYERAYPRGERIRPVLLDRARAHYNRKEWDAAAKAAGESGRRTEDPGDRRTAFRLAGEALFEAGRYPDAEGAFREILAASPPDGERAEAQKWVGFSMFRSAERFPASRGADAGALFLRIAREFPALPIVPEARFRAGAAFADAGRSAEAIDAYRSVETAHADSPLAETATRRLAALYEKTGQPLPAAERLERLSAGEKGGEARAGMLFRSAELYSRGKEEARSRKAYGAAAAVADAPAPLKILSLFRAGESARADGLAIEADSRYDEAVKIHRESGGAAPEIAGRALHRRAEAKLSAYLPIRIAPPLERTYAEKQQALEACVALYADAVRIGDAGTVSASLHRIGEALEDFRAAVLASPPPPELSSAEKEEYLFLLEERAAPIEERAVLSFRNNVRQAAAADHFDDWVAKSRERLRSLRPAVFGKRAEFAFPTVPVPDFVGITERAIP
ncbi:MAG: tetratricopeptide repeat protein [Deltaproteobacteria bacterium]|nr:tetratricopeptide repeat protein [Deltaproteobacteria bacterium]